MPKRQGGTAVGAPRLSSTPLPGIGVRYDLTTRERRRLSVVAHRDGTRTVNAYRTDDPDACALSVRLTAGETEALIDALKPSHHSPNLLSTTELGLVAERIELAVTSHWNGRLLGETRMRTETGASIVAVLRRAEAIPSPAPDFRLAGGDTLIVIGTREGVEAAAAILGRE
ncbi:cation:proton antiporter regulatory subunit [Streptomyces sp. NPDC004065]|uniref:cation:proton antiporter regulatory subunit n=1 Tax=Streptomyces sp. NPDC004065 TaxID=3364689 RepID=UPI00384D177F